MGLDLLDVSYRLEQQLGVRIDVDDWNSLVRDNDVEVGDLYLLILRRLGQQDVVRTSLPLNRYIWERMRDSLAAAAEVRAEAIELRTPLEQLLPAQTRRHVWEQLQVESPWPVGELEYPREAIALGWSLAIAAAVLEQWNLWRWGQPWGGLWLAAGAIGLWMVIEARRKIMHCLSPWRTRFPNRLRTVKDLCRRTLHCNLKAIADEDDLPIKLDSQAVDVWHQLRQVLVDCLGVDDDEVTHHSRLMRDLGLS